jgi:hypothetical protein
MLLWDAILRADLHKYNNSYEQVWKCRKNAARCNKNPKMSGQRLFVLRTVFGCKVLPRARWRDAQVVSTCLNVLKLFPCKSSFDRCLNRPWPGIRMSRHIRNRLNARKCGTSTASTCWLFGTALKRNVPSDILRRFGLTKLANFCCLWKTLPNHFHALNDYNIKKIS